MKVCLRIIILALFPSALSGQFLKSIDLNRGMPWTWGGVTQIELLDTAIYIGCHTSKRFNPVDGDKTIANYYGFSGTDLGFSVFPNQPQALGGGLRFLPGYGFTRSNVFKHPFNDSLVMDFYDLDGNLQWSRSGMERTGMSLIGVTSDSFAMGSSSSSFTPNPGIIKLDLRQGDISVLTFTDILDSLNSFYPSGNFQNLYFAQGGIIDSSNSAHFVLTTRDSTGYIEYLVYLTIDSDFNISATDTVLLNYSSLKRMNPYFNFDEHYFFKINENFDSVNNIANFSVEVFSGLNTRVDSFFYSQNNVPEEYLARPRLFYKNNHLAIASREIIAVPDRFDSTSFTYSYYSRFMLLDSNSTVLFEKNLRIDTNKYSRFVPEHILLDDSLNVYFVASHNDRFDWYLGKVTASGAIVNPLSYFSAPASKGNAFNLLPNPFKSSIQIETSKVGDYQLKLYSLNGQLVEKWQMENKQFFTINTENIPPGIYLYRLERKDTGKVLQSGKLIK